MSIPSNEEILALLDQLDFQIADDLESLWLEFKPWSNPKDSFKIAAELTMCFSNSDGGVIVFGVLDDIRGRSKAIQGASSYNLDSWRKDIYSSVRPNLGVAVEELAIPEGTGKLLLVRVPKGTNPPYGTAQGLYKKRIGKNCMPMDPHSFASARISSGAVDWSGQFVEGLQISDLDTVEIARARNVLRRTNPESDLLKLGDLSFLTGMGVVRNGRATNAALLLFGREETIRRLCPQHQVHYVYQIAGTKVGRNDGYQCGLLNVLDQLEGAFTGPANPEQEVTVGFHKLRIPAFSIDVVREGVLNAVTHRDYTDPGEVLIRHTARELVITSPGGFLADITPKNILRHEPITRNRTLAEAFEKLRLVERAGIGRQRIFVPCLSYGKRAPEYETDGSRVTLRVFDGAFDKRMAALIAEWKKRGVEIELDALLVLSHLREHPYIDTIASASLLQLSRDAGRTALDQLAQPRSGILERRGGTRTATYHLTKAVAKDLFGKAAYTKTRGLYPIRYAEMVKSFVQDHGAITPKECRELLGLGESQSAKVEVSRYLKKWSTGRGAFLRKEGHGPKTKYFGRRGVERGKLTRI